MVPPVRPQQVARKSTARPPPNALGSTPKATKATKIPVDVVDTSPSEDEDNDEDDDDGSSDDEISAVITKKNGISKNGPTPSKTAKLDSVPKKTAKRVDMDDGSSSSSHEENGSSRNNIARLSRNKKPAVPVTVDLSSDDEKDLDDEEASDCSD